MEITTLEKNLDLLKLGDKNIYLLGTAHVSQESVELVEKTIASIKPESVAIELCESRYSAFRDPDRWKKLDLYSVIKSGRSHVLLVQLLLAGYQKKLAKDLNIKPGAEMLAAAKSAEANNAQIVLADREVKTTLKRTWANLGAWSMFKVIGAMLESVFTDQKVSAEEIERLKGADALEEVMGEFAKAFPDVRTSLIDERDQYLAQRIKNAPGKNIVAVVGAGHVPGIKKYITAEIDLSLLENIPEPSALKKSLPWLLPAVVVLLILTGFLFIDSETGLKMVIIWTVVNFISAGLGALLALAHPLTILAAALSAPLTTIHPFLASGWVAGLVEAIIRKPLVQDLENIADDASSIRGFYKNRALRILLVIITTNLLGSIGMLIGVERILSIMK